jgi:hypothetical protein
MPCKDKPAFRCKSCGHLESADHAGEHAVPHACSCCGAGVCLSPKTKAIADDLASPNCSVERRKILAAELVKLQPGTEPKTFDPTNWEVLADCAPERLKELGIKECARHKATKGEPVSGKNVTANVAG